MEICKHGMFLDILLKWIHGSFCFQNAFPSGKTQCSFAEVCTASALTGSLQGGGGFSVCKFTTVHDPKNLEFLYRLVAVVGMANQS